MVELIKPAAKNSIGISALNVPRAGGTRWGNNVSESRSFIASLTLADYTSRSVSSIGMNAVSINKVARTSSIQSDGVHSAVQSLETSDERALSAASSGTTKSGILSAGATSVGFPKATPVKPADELRVDEQAAAVAPSDERLGGTVRPMTMASAVPTAVADLRKPPADHEDGVINSVSRPTDKQLLKLFISDSSKKQPTPPLWINPSGLPPADAPSCRLLQDYSSSLPTECQLVPGVTTSSAELLLVHKMPTTYPARDGRVVGGSGGGLFTEAKAHAVCAKASAKPVSGTDSISGRKETVSPGYSVRHVALAEGTIAAAQQRAGAALSTPLHITGDRFTVPVPTVLGLPIAKPIDTSLVASSAGPSAHAAKQVDATTLVEDQAAPRTLFAGPQRLEVGINNGLHGWLRVRAELGHAGEVTASVVTTSRSAETGLNREMSALHAYLKAESVGVASLRITSSQTYTGSTMNGGGETGTPSRHGSRKQSHSTSSSVISQSVQASSESGIAGSSPWLGGCIFTQSGGWLSVRV